MEGNEEDIGASFFTSEPYIVDNPVGHGHEQDDDDDEAEIPSVLREQDRFLPIANIGRIMKRAIPKTGKGVGNKIFLQISKDAKVCVQECVSEFISFVTSEASDRCIQEKRKTINGEDILWAMDSLGFENYVGPLKICLQKFRESSKGDNPVEGTSDGTYAVDYTNTMGSSPSDPVNQPEIVYTYGPGGQITQNFM